MGLQKVSGKLRGYPSTCLETRHDTNLTRTKTLLKILVFLSLSTLVPLLVSSFSIQIILLQKSLRKRRKPVYFVINECRYKLSKSNWYFSFRVKDKEGSRCRLFSLIFVGYNMEGYMNFVIKWLNTDIRNMSCHSTYM